MWGWHPFAEAGDAYRPSGGPYAVPGTSPSALILLHGQLEDLLSESGMEGAPSAAVTGLLFFLQAEYFLV